MATQNNHISLLPQDEEGITNMELDRIEELEKYLPLEVEDIENMTTEQINGLKAGQFVVKKTGDQKHTYIVSYKEDEQGICLTYTDASCVETISYDYTEGEWVFNSKDITPLGE